MSTMNNFNLQEENIPDYVKGEISLDHVYLIGKGINDKIVFKFFIANKEKTETFCINDGSVSKRVKLIRDGVVDIYNYIGESIDYSRVIRLSSFKDYANLEMKKMYEDFGFTNTTNYEEICRFNKFLDERLNKKSNVR